jgi:hypothetical protein
MKLGKLHIHRHHLPHICAGLFALWLLVTIGMPALVPPLRANAAQVASRSVKISDATTGATGVSYMFGFTTITSGPIGSITFEICTNYLYTPSSICNPPPGTDVSGAGLNSSSGVTDFSLQPPTTPSKLLITRPAALPVTPQALMYEISGINNPADTGSYYVHIATFASTDGTGPETDAGDVVFATNDDIQITTEVPPYLYFCVGVTITGFNCGTADGGFISFGELSTTTTRAASSQMLAATNAPYGYSITLAGSTMTAGNNVIPAMTGGPSQIGTSQFGLNARQNTGPSVGAEPDGPGFTTPTASYNSPNQFRFVSGDIITSNSTTDDYRKITVSYIVNRDKNQAAGRYVATISYICLANF